jgi:Glycosyltransferase family 87
MLAPSSTRRWDWRAISLRLWFVLVVGTGVVIPAAAFDNLKIIPTRSDFITFYTAGSLARDGRAGDVYNPQAMDMAATVAAGEPVDGLRWLYPPGMLLVTWPFALLAPLPAYLLWLGLGVIAVAFVAWRIAPHPATPLVVLFCPAVTYCAITGQISLFAAALAGAGFLSLQRRPLIAGVLFGVLTLKIQLALLVPFCLLAGRHYRTLGNMAATAILLQLLGFVLAGPTSALAFLGGSPKILGVVVTRPELLARLPTVYSLLIGAGAKPASAMVFQGAASIAAIGIVWFIWRHTEDLAARSLGWAAGVMLATPFVYDYDLAIFVTPLAAIAWNGWHHRVGWIDAAVMTLLWLAPFAMRYATGMAGFQVGPPLAVLLLAYAVWYGKQGASSVEPAQPGARELPR